ncbi:MAG: hypothetical protein ACMUIM_09665 [bacterium]
MNMGEGKRHIQSLTVLAIIGVFVFLVCNMAVAQDFRDRDTFIWQDFEYWHAPANYGWKSSCPAYPVFGF